MHHVLNQVLASLKGLGGVKRRRMVAIAGAPASGKSTLADELVERLNAEGMRSVLVPMDGFHLDNPILETRGRRQRKGAPDTFDAWGIISLIKRMQRGETVFAPRFDRSSETAIAAAIEVPSDIDWIVIEGNYLLLKDDPWYRLDACFDFTVFLSVSEHELETRLVERWLSHGFSEQDARAKAEQNDLTNARYVMRNSLPAMMTLRCVDTSEEFDD